MRRAESWDADDTPSTDGRYGSFQVSAVGDQPGSATAPSTVLAVNRFTAGGGDPVDIGIGPAPAGTQQDWTFAGNAGDFTTRTLTVYARDSQVVLSAGPQDRQLHPRDTQGAAQDGATVTVSATVTDAAVDAVRLTVT